MVDCNVHWTENTVKQHIFVRSKSSRKCENKALAKFDACEIMLLYTNVMIANVHTKHYMWNAYLWV